MFSLLHAFQVGLRIRYAEPHRAYHGQAHIDAMLVVLHALNGSMLDPAAAELAIWYHDAIYDPAAKTNEARSAELLRAELGGLADPALLTRAEQMVRATAGHVLPADMPATWQPDCAAFLDLDLAVLGAAQAAYDAYEQGIAAEYLAVYDAASYRLGRAAFIRTLLARPRLFLTERAHAALDRPARANLTRALAGLERGDNLSRT